MEAKDLLTRARVQLQNRSPFFSYLCMNLNLIESKEVPTCAVDNKGNFYYNKKFVEGLSEEQIYGTLIHELLHLALDHLDRRGKRDVQLSNISMDLCVNNIVQENNFMLPENGLIPQDNEFTFKLTKDKTYTVKNIDRKSFEKIYDELYGKLPKNKIKVYSGKGFDKHIRGKKNKSASESKEEKQLKKRWKQLMVEASQMARQQGKLPAGIERLVEELIEPKLNWKSLLYRYITNTLPMDYSYSKPSKRSISVGFYMPYIKKEEVDIAIAVDTSGSISQTELTEFLSEMVGISKSFANLNMYVIICDAKVQEVLEIKNGSIPQIMDIKCKGGGGTDHKVVFEHIRENKPSTKLLIAFTDGYTDLPDEITTNTIWVICKGGTTEHVKDTGEVIEL